MTSRFGVAKIGLGIGVLALAIAGCGSSSKSSATGSTTTAPLAAPTSPTTKAPAPVQAIVSANSVKVIPGSATGTSPCEEAAPTPASPGEVGAGAGGSTAAKSPAEVAATEHGERGAVQQVTLSASEQSALNAQMAAAKSVAMKYPTVKDAEAAGYAMTTAYVPCIGAHFTNIGLTAHFDPARPSELLYAGTSPDSKIVGLSYLVYHHDGPPPGFAGPNDRWHQHNANGGLCFKGGVVISGEESTRAECAAAGGAQVAAHRHLDGARMGRTRHHVRLGRVQR